MARSNSNATDALNSPVHAAERELHTADMAIGQQPSIILHDDQPIDHEQVIIPVDRQPAAKYLAKLAFAEEPVTIRVERSAEKFAPNSVDCWCNGIGAEVFMNGRWMQLGYLPVGHAVTTKRKYVEILARSKHDSIQTKVEQMADTEQNTIDRHTSMRTPFSVLKDANPEGHAWLTRLLAES